MRSNIEIDEILIAKAQMLSNIQDKNIIIEKALQLYISIGDPNILKDLREMRQLSSKTKS